MQCSNASRSWPACRQTSRRPEKTSRARLAALLVTLGLLVSACAPTPPQREPEREVPIEVEIDRPEPPPAPPEPPVPPPKPVCNWSQTKGVAEVVGLEDMEAEFRFYPGNVRVPIPKGARFENGSEHKAVLLRADGCKTRLEVIDPVP